MRFANYKLTVSENNGCPLATSHKDTFVMASDVVYALNVPI